MRSERRARHRSRDAGMVTAELAACLPVLVLFLTAAFGIVSVAGQRVRAQDGAREAARIAARGGVPRELCGSRCTVRIDSTSRAVVATVRITVRPLGGLLPEVTVVEQATSLREDGLR